MTGGYGFGFFSAVSIFTERTDCHTSDIGHLLRNDGVFYGSFFFAVSMLLPKTKKRW